MRTSWPNLPVENSSKFLKLFSRFGNSQKFCALQKFCEGHRASSFSARSKQCPLLPPKENIDAYGWNVRFVQKADSCIAAKAPHSITSPARASGIGGISRDRASLRRFDPYFFARSITKHVATIDPLG
ncbi:MAG: hypothetical protein WCB26_01090, partial [Pseudolabrys sp.]